MTYEDKRISQGYYSILQYVPDIERGEGANIGVLLFCPKLKFFDILVDEATENVKRLFPKDSASKFDSKRFKLFKDAFAERIHTEKDAIRSFKSFVNFIEARANQFVLTPPRDAVVDDPKKDLQDLFERLVEITPKRVDTSVVFDLPDISQQFDFVLTQKGIRDRITSHRVFLKYFGEKRFQYSYHNGRINVIEMTTIKRNTQEGTICKLAVEGKALREEHQIQLNVLAAISPDAESKANLTQVLTDYSVDVYFDPTTLADTIAQQLKH